MKKTYKLILSVLIIFCSTLYWTMYVHGYDEEEHNDFLERVLFGSESFKDGKSDRIKEKIKTLEYASYISIDQYNASQHPNDKEKIEYLKSRNISDVPELNDIDFSGNQYHRKYTHKGWDFNYSSAGRDKANWEIRKNLLINAVNKELDFGFFSRKFLWFDYDKKCKSFAALVYYVHVLGDHIDNKWEKRSVGVLMIHLADAHDKNNSLTKDLREHLKILFKDQQNTYDYKELMSGIDRVEDTAEAVINGSGGVNTEEDFKTYHDCSVDLMNLLIGRVPKLLKKESFFANVFYDE